VSAVETLLVYWQDHRDQLRQSENQRAVLINQILINVATFSGLIVQPHFDPVTIPLSVLIIVVGRSGHSLWPSTTSAPNTTLLEPEH
jgi:hypothetical protein